MKPEVWLPEFVWAGSWLLLIRPNCVSLLTGRLCLLYAIFFSVGYLGYPMKLCLDTSGFCIKVLFRVDGVKLTDSRPAEG